MFATEITHGIQTLTVRVDAPALYSARTSFSQHILNSLKNAYLYENLKSAIAGGIGCQNVFILLLLGGGVGRRKPLHRVHPAKNASHAADVG